MLTVERAETDAGGAREVPLEEMNGEKLRRMVAEVGYEETVDAVWRGIRGDVRHGAFMRRVEGMEHVGDLRGVRVAIVPGALYREYPETGADGGRFVEILEGLGIKPVMLPVKTLGSLEGNARIIVEWLRGRAAGEKWVLVSFSKGSADIKWAMREAGNDGAFGAVRGWLSVGGILHGSPLVGWLNERRMRHFAVKMVLRMKGVDAGVLQQMGHGAGTQLDEATRVLAGVRLVNLVALPKEGEWSMGLARRAFERLLPLGPNDGGGLMLSDLRRFPGVIYPVMGADHYLKGFHDLPGLVGRLMTVMTDEGNAL